MKYYIQSISDIITNSSSEVFCIIESENALDQIKEILESLFQQSSWDDTPWLTYVDLDDEKFEEWCSDWKTRTPRKYIEVNMPYSYADSVEFYKAGLEALLSNKVPDNFKIHYEN